MKLLGALALIDENETDWKIIAVNEKDPLAGKLNGKRVLAAILRFTILTPR